MIEEVTTPKCVLLDANIVIEAYSLGIWEKLLERIVILVPSIVVGQEALFYRRKDRKIPKPINLKGLIKLRKIKQVTASAVEMMSLRTIFDKVFIEGIDDGELEALALIKENKIKGALFCTGDAPAIQALAMIEHSASGISMETLLRKVGLPQPLSKQFREEFFKDNLRKGEENLITGQGMNPERKKER